MGNENQGPPRGSELKWLSHAAGGCALPAENLGERRRRYEKHPSPGRRLPPFNHPLPTSPAFFCYLILSFPAACLPLPFLSLFSIRFCSYQRSCSHVVFKTTCRPPLDRHRYSIPRDRGCYRWIERLYPGASYPDMRSQKLSRRAENPEVITFQTG